MHAKMTALSVIGSNLITSQMAPFTAKTGGTSKSDPNAGSTEVSPDKSKPITTADKAGAGILTILVIIGIVGGSICLIL